MVVICLYSWVGMPAWTEKEEEFLHEYASGALSAKEVARHVGRSPQAVAARAYKLGLTKRSWNKNLPQEVQDQVVRLYQKGLVMSQVQAQTGLSYHQVRWCLNQAGVPVDRKRSAVVATQNQRRVLTESEQALIEQCWLEGLSVQRISERVGCWRRVVERFIQEQGWGRSREQMPGYMEQRRTFSPEEQQAMVGHYLSGLYGQEATMQEFGVSKKVLRRVLRENGVDAKQVASKRHAALIQHEFHSGKRHISPRAGVGIRSYFDVPLQGRVLLRSTTERLRALYLMKQGIAWFYEIRRFTLQNGETYLPDFWVLDRSFAEVERMLGGSPGRKQLQALAAQVPHKVEDVKGWWDKRHPSWDKIQTFKREHPVVDFSIVLSDGKGDWICL